MGMYNQDNANVAVVREREEKSECQQVVELVGAIVAIAVGCYVGFLLYDYHSENALGTTSKNIQKVLAGTHDTDDSGTPVTVDDDCERDGQPGCLTNFLWRSVKCCLAYYVILGLIPLFICALKWDCWLTAQCCKHGYGVELNVPGMMI